MKPRLLRKKAKVFNAYYVEIWKLIQTINDFMEGFGKTIWFAI